MTTAVQPHEATVRRYLRFWSATTKADQQRLAEETFTDDVNYVALIGVLTGPQALIDFHDQFVDHMGPVEFVAREEPEGHHDRVRVKWEIRLATGESFAEGTDMLVVASDGRINSVTAFLDRAPEGFEHDAHD